MMLFVCSRCDCVDSVELAYLSYLPVHPEEQLCTLCKTGAWHGQFEHRVFDPEYDNVCNRPTGISID